MRQHPQFLDAIRKAAADYGLPVSQIAALAGLREQTIERYLRREGVQVGASKTPVAVRKRFSKLARDVLPKMETAARELTEREGEWDKARLDVMTQLGRLLDRFGELAATENEQQESAKDRDERTAETLRKIDKRIVELAEALAIRMGEEQSGS